MSCARCDVAVDLPVLEIKSELESSLRSGNRVLLKAPTGSGKSTCVPQMILDSQLAEGMILVVQPRRIAARMLATWVAKLRGVKLGEEVGYAVRFDSKYNKQTKILFLTDGLLQRMLQDDPDLAGVACVVFDEFHERRLASDLCLARCLDLQDGGNNHLKLVVMSATLEQSGLAQYLSPCASLEAMGRSYPVDIHYRSAAYQPAGGAREVARNKPVWEQAADAAKELVAQTDGHLLVFMPGGYEIRKTITLLENASWAKGYHVYPLYSNLPIDQQELAIHGSGKKIIVSTNVAETSLTIEGITAVIDSGLARIAVYDSTRGLDSLLIRKISKASADQRAGRAGRTAPGLCVRLWSQAEHAKRDDFDSPEVQRMDITEALLGLKSQGVDEIADYRWLDAPKEETVSKSLALLHQLGAIDELEMLTEDGSWMMRMPIHPRYACLILSAAQHGCVAEAAFVAAAEQAESLFLPQGDALESFTYDGDVSDFAAYWRAFQWTQNQNRLNPSACRNKGLSARGARELGQSFRQLEQMCRRLNLPWKKVNFDENQFSLASAMFVPFADRLGQKMGSSTLACRLVGGRRGQLDKQSVARGGELFVAAEVTEVGGKDITVHLKRCTVIDKQELIGRADQVHLSELNEAIYDEQVRRVVQRHELRWRDIVIVSKVGGEPDAERAAELLAERVASGELVLKFWDRDVDRWIARVVNLSEWMPELEMPGFSSADREVLFTELCLGAKSYKEIKSRKVMPVLRQWLSPAQHEVLAAYAPEQVVLANGRKAKVYYAEGKEPWIALRLQHLYDVDSLPQIAGGNVDLLVHILAPNQRPWQITKDLAGFWKTGYPQMKKDLAGRYPRHEWR